ncbi:MAG: XdhC family protein [Thermoprotei archaeon]
MEEESVNHRIVELLEDGQPFVVVTVVRTSPAISVKPGSKAIIRADRSVEGWLGGSCVEPQLIEVALNCLKGCEVKLVQVGQGPQKSEQSFADITLPNYCISGGSALFLMEPYITSQIIVIGDNRIAEVVNEIAKLVGFKTIQLTRDGMDDAKRVNLNVTSKTIAVVATMGKYDDISVQLTLEMDVPHVLLISSKKRWEGLKKILLDKGVPSDKLERVKAPAGVDIGAKSPEEIGVSIIAEAIEILNRQRVTTRPPKVEIEENVAKDIVCEMVVSVSTPYKADLQNKAYYFCSEYCLNKFLEEPSKYVYVEAKS